jgi:hypothetical protein
MNRTALSFVSGSATDAVEPVGAEPLGLKDRAAKFFDAGSEGGLSGSWGRAGADAADADSVLEDGLGDWRVFVALSAADAMAVRRAKPFGLEDFASEFLDAGPELGLSGERVRAPI